MSTPRCQCDPITNRGHHFNEWIGYWFGQCVYSTSDYIGFVLGVINLAVWTYIYFPQIYATIKAKGKGLSPTMLIVWISGDITGLLGLFFTNQKGLLLVTQLYFTLMDTILFIQWLYYTYWAKKPSNNPNDVIIAELESKAKNTKTLAEIRETELTSLNDLQLSTTTITPIRIPIDDINNDYLNNNFQEKKIHFGINNDHNNNHHQEHEQQHNHQQEHQQQHNQSDLKQYEQLIIHDKQSHLDDIDDGNDDTPTSLMIIAEDDEEPITSITTTVHHIEDNNINDSTMTTTPTTTNNDNNNDTTDFNSTPTTTNDTNTTTNTDTTSTTTTTTSLKNLNTVLTISICLLYFTTTIDAFSSSKLLSLQKLQPISLPHQPTTLFSTTTLSTSLLFSSLQHTPTIPNCTGADLQQWQKRTGTIFAYLSAAIYAPSRLLQAIHNYKRKSTHGLSKMFIGLAAFASILYIGQILIPVSRWDATNGYTSQNFYLETFPYLLASIGELCINISICVQIWLYWDKTQADKIGIDIDDEVFDAQEEYDFNVNSKLLLSGEDRFQTLVPSDSSL